MLVKLNDLIVNTDQIIKAELNRKTSKPTLTIYLTDGGVRPNPPQVAFHNLIMLTGDDAEFMWTALTQIAQVVIPSTSSSTR